VSRGRGRLGENLCPVAIRAASAYIAEPCGPGLNRNPSGAVAAIGLADDLNVLRLGSLLALGDVELDLLPFVEAAVAATGDRAEVHEHIWATFNLDKAVALVAVEPLHRALRHLDLLRSGCGARHGDEGPTTTMIALASLSRSARCVDLQSPPTERQQGKHAR